MLCEPWADISDVTCSPCADYSFDPAYLTDGLELASEILYNLTQGAYPGVCEDVIRPPADCSCRNRCRCGWVSEIVLPGWPAVAVSEVLIDGDVIAPARYRLDNSRLLVWLPDYTDLSGARGWPRIQRADRPPTEEGTWQVSYTWGATPPAGGVQAAAILGCEIARACAGDEGCRLPKGTVSVTKKNVAVAIADPAQLAERGETGIPEVDLWIRADRWARKNRGGAVYSSTVGTSRRS